MNLDDEHIALLEAALANIEDDYRPTCEQARYGNGCRGPTDASIDFWRRAVDCVPALIARLRAAEAVVQAAEKLAPRLEPFGGGDWACAECRPSSDILVAGFRCHVHALRTALSAYRATKEQG